MNHVILDVTHLCHFFVTCLMWSPPILGLSKRTRPSAALHFCQQHPTKDSAGFAGTQMMGSL